MIMVSLCMCNISVFWMQQIVWNFRWLLLLCYAVSTKISVEYAAFSYNTALMHRIMNLELMSQYGCDAWKLSNSVLQQMLETARKQLIDLKYVLSFQFCRRLIRALFSHYMFYVKRNSVSVNTLWYVSLTIDCILYYSGILSRQFTVSGVVVFVGPLSPVCTHQLADPIPWNTWLICVQS